MKTSENINELADALSQAQGEIQNPAKDSDNPFFKSKYADLADVLNVVRPAFSKVGLSVVQLPSSKDGNIALTTRVMHKSGQWLEDEFNLPFQGKNIAQEAGKTISYMRRYALAAVAGVFQEDNDGNLGSSKADNTGSVQSLAPARIGPDQLKELLERIAETDTDSGAFCQWLKVGKLEDLNPNHFDTARNALIKKEAANAS